MWKSQFIPTSNIEEYSNYYLVQLLARERIISIMEKTPFKDTSQVLVERYLTVPPALQKSDEVQNFIKTEAAVVLGEFKRFEEEKLYKQSLEQLKHYTGYKYEITSVTLQGIMVLVEIPEGE